MNTAGVAGVHEVSEGTRSPAETSATSGVQRVGCRGRDRERDATRAVLLGEPGVQGNPKPPDHRLPAKQPLVAPRPARERQGLEDSSKSEKARKVKSSGVDKDETGKKRRESGVCTQRSGPLGLGNRCTVHVAHQAPSCIVCGFVFRCGGTRTCCES